MNLRKTAKALTESIDRNLRVGGVIVDHEALRAAVGNAVYAIPLDERILIALGADNVGTAAYRVARRTPDGVYVVEDVEGNWARYFDSALEFLAKLEAADE